MRKILTILAFSLFSLTICAQDSYKMAGPYEIIARDGEHRATKGGSERDMRTAWDFAIAGTTNATADAEQKTAQSLQIINAYAKTLKSLVGHDAPLCLIQGYYLVRAMTLLQQHKTPEWDAMVRRAFLPVMEKFEADSPYANGNWGAIVNRMRMASAIYLNDKELYQAAIDYYLHANDNGSLPKYVDEIGQCQETGRDQAHAQLGLGALCETCEMAWSQGDDLWGALDNRLMKGLEYTARYNLGYDVPFKQWTDCTGLYNDWTEPGAMARGKIREIYDAAYHHYVNVKGLKMPYTKKILKLQKKAEKEGKVSANTEARVFTVEGVREMPRLHKVYTYKAPEGAPLKYDYDVFVQAVGQKEWTRIDTYMAKVNAPVGNSKHRISEISYAFFDFTGVVKVKVISKKKKFKEARIRPDYRGVIANVQNDSTVQFQLFQPENVSVEMDGDITDNLLIFTSKPVVTVDEAKKQAEEQGREFVYYAPGLYTDKMIALRSNTTYYLDGGAYFTGSLVFNDVTDASIIGRGVARPEDGYEGSHVHRSRNILIDGLILNTCPIGESHNVTLRDVRSISHPAWGDGLNVFGGCTDILYDRVFCRNSDDCTTAYATRKGFTGSVSGVTMRNSTLWADVAHPIMIGIHGIGSLSEKSDTISHLRYENIDILCQSEPQVDYQGCLAINCGDNNVVKDVVFDNIRIENLHQGSLFHVKTCYNSKYCSAPGRSVEDVLFRNIRYNGEQPYLSIISGYDEDHKVKNITFEGLKINGKVIHDKMPGKPGWYKTTDMVPAYVDAHVENLVFNK